MESLIAKFVQIFSFMNHLFIYERKIEHCVISMFNFEIFLKLPYFPSSSVLGRSVTRKTICTFKFWWYYCSFVFVWWMETMAIGNKVSKYFVRSRWLLIRLVWILMIRFLVLYFVSRVSLLLITYET